VLFRSIGHDFNKNSSVYTLEFLLKSCCNLLEERTSVCVCVCVCAWTTENIGHTDLPMTHNQWPLGHTEGAIPINYLFI